MLDYNKYKNKMVLKSKEDFTVYNVYKEGEVLVKNGNQDAVRQIAIWSTPLVGSSFYNVKDVLVRKNYLIESVVDEDAYKKHRSSYNVESGRLHDLFKADLEKEYGVTDNPKKDLLYSKAYDAGHSGGFSEIENSYSDLVDLIL
jgi:hypothetical protein